MKMKSYSNGFGLYILLILMVIFFWYFFAGQSAPTFTWAQLYSALKEDGVESVEIHQNAEVPTGSARILLKGSTEARTLYLSDVGDLEDLLKSIGVSYTITDVPQDQWLSDMLPMLIVVAVLFLLFMIMMNGQAGMGGALGLGNSRMMNFGKSHARKTSQDKVDVRFDHVAGLKEEKEELEEIVDFLKHPAK
ncbi:MAG: ATP-dependent metallopeptidase FtsH/Yme1/Tma family protein, partial [Lachnospiraceae bacterium]|nr:ATP-dependent metallopeptidase FtsH/Yme1/Tma family protein [Lachnospiraceae bacterium]